MKVCSLRASARAAARLRRGVRRGVARRLDARLRRPSRPALSRLARDELRPGAVGVGPRLVGGLSGAAVLSARVRVPRRALRVADHGRSRRRDGLPGAALARLSPARSHDVRRARAADRPALARAARGLRRAHAVGGAGQRRGWRRAHGDGRSAPRVGALAVPAGAPGALGRGRASAVAGGAATARRRHAAASRSAAGGGGAGGAGRLRPGAVVAASPRGSPRADPGGGADRVLDAAAVPPVGGDARAGVGDAFARRGRAPAADRPRGPGRRRPARPHSRGRRRASGALVAPRDGRGDRARSPGGGAARHPLAASRSRRRRRLDRARRRRRRGRGAAGAAPRRDADHGAPGRLAAQPGVRARCRRAVRAALAGQRHADAPAGRRGLALAVVVALEDDVTQLGWLAESTAFRRRLSLAPFVVFTRESAVALPTPRDGVWRTTLAGEAGGWTCARVAYYPLWRADADGAPLPTRRGADGLLEVRLTRALQTVTLRYDPGVPELAGVVLSAVALAAWAVSAWRSG